MWWIYFFGWEESLCVYFGLSLIDRWREGSQGMEMMMFRLSKLMMTYVLHGAINIKLCNAEIMAVNRCGE